MPVVIVVITTVAAVAGTVAAVAGTVVATAAIASAAKREEKRDNSRKKYGTR